MKFDGTDLVRQNSQLKLGQRSIISEKPGHLPEKLKTWRAPTTIEFNSFGWSFAHISYLPISECVETKSFLILANNSRSKKKKKNPEHPFVDIGK